MLSKLSPSFHSCMAAGAKLAGSKQYQQVVKQQRKGQTLREIEESEGGPVKESLVGMAAVQRALRRKKAPGEL
jgi:hypothetical protein